MEEKEFQSWVRANAAARERMEQMTAGLSEKELSLPMDSGWTPSAALAHLAFWDARAIILIRKWQKEGVGPSPTDTDVINDSVCELSRAIPPRAAVALALRKAAELDAIVEKLSPEWVDKILTFGTAVHLKRFTHRNEHLDEIEKALGTKK
jgi:hypothetical protein